MKLLPETRNEKIAYLWANWFTQVKVNGVVFGDWWERTNKVGCKDMYLFDDALELLGVKP